jgi:hypothetical protein
MSLFCDAGYDHDGADWWWYQPDDEAPLATKRSRKCCSCGQKVGVGDTARRILRFRAPTDFEYTRGLADEEVPLADWYLCETCGDLADSLSELGFCYHLGNGESLKQQIADYRRDEGAPILTHNAELRGGPAVSSPERPA